MPEETNAKPTGTLPKNLQLYGLLAIALLIVGVIFFTPAGKKEKPAADPGQKAISEAASQLERSMASLKEAQERAQQEALTAERDAAMLPPPMEPTPDPNASPDPDQQLEQARRKREYDAQFSSNLALSYRKRPAETSGAQTGARTANEELPPEPGTPEAEFADIKQQMKQLEAAALAATAPAAATTQPTTATTTTFQRNTTALNRARPGVATHTVFEGSVLEAALVTRLAGDFSGPVIATTTAPLYSRNRQAVLVPTGTKLLGEAKRVDGQNQERLAVAFHRALMPDGYSVDLDQFTGLDGLGQTALKDQVNNHYLRTFGTSLALGLLGGLSALTSNQTELGLPASAVDRYQQGFGSSMGTQASTYLQAHTNTLPTITIREGHRVRVYISQDFRLPPYGDHRMDPAL
jgi:type IV secretion system protein VirB10